MTQSTFKASLIARAALVAACATVLSGCAADQARQGTPTSSARRCFMASSVTNFRAVDDRTINIRVAGGEVYRLEAVTFCSGLGWSSRISMAPRFGSTICVGDRITVAFRNVGRVQRCPVFVAAQLTPEQVEALTSRQRP